MLDQLIRAEALAIRNEADEGSEAPVAGPVTAADLSAAMPDERTAVLEYVTGRGGEPTTLFVVTRNGIAAHVLAPVDSLAGPIERYVALLEADAEHHELGRALAAALLDPALAALDPKVRHLIVVADGVVHRLPMDALVLRDGPYVVERYTVSRVPSAAVAVQLWRRPPASRPAQILAVADPVFPGEAISQTATARTGITRDAGAMPRLEGSAREARLVARFARAQSCVAAPPPKAGSRLSRSTATASSTSRRTPW